MKLTVYLPDDLGQQVRNQLGDTNISRICQWALQVELRRAAKHLDPDDVYERVEIDTGDGHLMAFSGKLIASEQHPPRSVYLTRKGSIAVFPVYEEDQLDCLGESTGGALAVHAAFSDFEAHWQHRPEVIKAVRAHFGIRTPWVEELDI